MHPFISVAPAEYFGGENIHLPQKRQLHQWRMQENISGMSAPLISGGFVDGALRVPEIFRKFWKNYIIKLQKLHYVSTISKDSKPTVKFSRVEEKRQLIRNFWENFEHFCSKFNIQIEFLSMLWKMCCYTRAFGKKIIFYNNLSHFVWFETHEPTACANALNYRKIPNFRRYLSEQLKIF